MDRDMSSSPPKTPCPSRRVEDRPIDMPAASTDRAGPGNFSNPIVIDDAGPETDSEGYDTDDELGDDFSSSSSHGEALDNNANIQTPAPTSTAARNRRLL